MPTRRTHQASASLRLRATPPATRVSRIERSDMRRRVITGMLMVVKIFVSPPHRAPQATLRRNSCSASRASRTLSARDSSRNRSIRAWRAADRLSGAAAVTSTSGSVPTTRISSPSELISAGPANQPGGILAANQVGMSSGIDYNITARAPSPSSVCLRGHLLGPRAEPLELLDDDLGPVALLACGVLPAAGLEAALREHQAALVQVLAGELGRLPKSDQVVKLCLLPRVAIVVLARVGVGGEPDVGDI